MKKGIIIEIKNKQKVILSDNGRFYVSTLKKDEQLGQRVSIGLNKRRLASISLVAFIAITAFLSGMFIMSASKENLAETLVRIEDTNGLISAEFIINSKGKVLSIAPLTKEAAIILIDENFVSKSIEGAAILFVQLALRCGYIKYESDNAIIVNSFNDNVKIIENINSRIIYNLDTHFKENLIRLVPITNFNTAIGVTSLYNCGFNILAPVYIVSVIKQMEGDERKILDIVEEVKQYSDIELMVKINQAHVKYYHNLSLSKKNSLALQKNALMELNKNVTNSLNTQQEINSYNVWLKNKSQIINQYKNSLININPHPLYLAN